MPAAKKAMPGAATSKTCGSSGAMKWVWGIVAIILGLAIWMNYLTLAQFFGIVFVLMGVMKLFGQNCCH